MKNFKVIGAIIANSRDDALLILGNIRIGITKKNKIEEGFEPGFEGNLKTRSLPFVMLDKTKVYYKVNDKNKKYGN